MNSKYLELSKYRIQRAREDLGNSIEDLKSGFIKGSINRSYYAIFHAIRAVLALDFFDTRKHSGIISFFQKNYVKTGQFDVSFSKIIENAFEIRTKSDYDDFYIASIVDAEEQVKNATAFIIGIEGYLIKIWEQKENMSEKESEKDI